MTSKVVKISDNAFFVPSYSEQTIFPAYDAQSTVQGLSYGADETERPWKEVAKPDPFLSNRTDESP
jgi:hypothetical protein